MSRSFFAMVWAAVFLGVVFYFVAVGQQEVEGIRAGHYARLMEAAR